MNNEASLARPTVRPRRLRRTEALRRLVRETSLRSEQLIYPIFVTPAGTPVEPVPSMPGISRYPVEAAYEHALLAAESGIGAVLLFGVVRQKDAEGRCAADPEGPVPSVIRRIKAHRPDFTVITDVCLCAYTEHGHCGPLTSSGTVDNDAALPHLAAMALTHAEAGADLVAPSAMMDGQVAAIRSRFDAAGYTETGILSYAVKYASSYYGPFRDAADSAPAMGDRRSYQMDPANAREALREAELDVAEGADMLMVKPALAYLDVIRSVADVSPVPLAAYNVSGEYSMVKAAAAQGWLDERSVVMESLLGMRRAGADCIITYHALDVARWLRQG